MSYADDIKRINFQAIVMQLTNRCSARCRSCMRNCSSDKGDVLSLKQVTDILDQAARIGGFEEAGFNGGECFLYRNLLVRACQYAYHEHGLSVSASTNACWATSPKMAERRLHELVTNGLQGLLVSIDDFHLEFVPIGRIRNCVSAATSMGVKCTLQVISTRSSRRIADLVADLGVEEGAPLVEWVENPCDPIGRAKRAVPDEEFVRSRVTSRWLCTVLRLLSVDIQGNVVTCCGTGAEAPGLVVGNIFAEPIEDIIQRANQDPIQNSLTMNGGPYQLLDLLSDLGEPEWAEAEYTSPCDACYQILSDKRVTTRLRERLAPEWMELLAMRVGYQASVVDHLRTLAKKKKMSYNYGTAAAAPPCKSSG